MGTDETRPVARRTIIAAGAAAAAAIAAQGATAILGPAAVRAADGDALVVGKTNSGSGSTWVSTDTASPSLGAESGAGDGVQGASGGDAKSGVYGTSAHAKGYGVFGRNLVTHATGNLAGPLGGVAGVGPDEKTRGILGGAQLGATGEHMPSGNFGGLGSAEGGAVGAFPGAKTVGILGHSTAGVTGIHQEDEVTGSLGTRYAGVTGENPVAKTKGSLGTALAGVHAETTGPDPALLVQGHMRLMDGGVGMVPKGASSVKIARPKPTGVRAAVAVLQVHRPGIAVAAAVVDKATGAVTIHLTKKVATATPVAYFLFNTPGMD
jgi:hypothetical protein